MQCKQNGLLIIKVQTRGLEIAISSTLNVYADKTIVKFQLGFFDQAEIISAYIFSYEVERSSYFNTYLCQG